MKQFVHGIGTGFTILGIVVLLAGYSTPATEMLLVGIAIFTGMIAGAYK